MMTEQQTIPVSATTGTAVAVNGLRKSFGDVIAVDGVDLVVAPGEVVALLGPNGAGKTTTIEMLLGLRKPDGGTARVFDLDPHEAVRTGRVGAMMQTGGLVGDVTVREVVHLIASMHSAPLTVAARSSSRASPTSPTARSRPSRAASASGCSSRWRSSPTPT